MDRISLVRAEAKGSSSDHGGGGYQLNGVASKERTGFASAGGGGGLGDGYLRLSNWMPGKLSECAQYLGVRVMRSPPYYVTWCFHDLCVFEYVTC